MHATTGDRPAQEEVGRHSPHRAKGLGDSLPQARVSSLRILAELWEVIIDFFWRRDEAANLLRLAASGDMKCPPQWLGSGSGWMGYEWRPIVRYLHV